MNEKLRPFTLDVEDLTEDDLDEALDRAGMTRELIGERTEQGWALATRLQAAEQAKNKGQRGS